MGDTLIFINFFIISFIIAIFSLQSRDTLIVIIVYLFSIMILLSLFQSKRLEFSLQLLGLLLLLLLLIIAYYTKTYIFVTVVPDDDLVEEPCDEPSGTRTPPTPEVSPSHAPPPPAPPLRQRAMAQLLPVSVPAVIKDMAGKVV